MNQNQYQFYYFMRAARGNWRNTLYVKSCGKGCCEGFLIAADADGSLIISSVAEIRQLTGEIIDPSECYGTLTRKSFEAIFSQYIEWHTISDLDCPLQQLYRNTGCPQ